MVSEKIERGECVLGIELGSTRIKAILIDDDCQPVAVGTADWENRNVDGVWSYTLSDVHGGLAACYADLKRDVAERYRVRLRRVKAMGISAMMHGFMAFDREGNLLTPFRTWRNSMTEKESEILTRLFDYPIPQRWTIAHFLKDIRNRSGYLDRVDYITILSGYVHGLLTGEKVIGIGDASGMFPVDTLSGDFQQKAVDLFKENWGYDIRALFPRVLTAGNVAGHLTPEGARLLDCDGELEPGCPLCPPEGDAQTGMVATNAITPGTGNVSAGTSAFAMVVLEKPLSRAYSALDLVTTADGTAVAMAHTNNCTAGYDSWISLFGEVVERMGMKCDKSELYEKILPAALEADADCGGVVSYPFLAGEPIVDINDGVVMTSHTAAGVWNLSNFIRAELFGSVAAMRKGLDILFEKEGVKLSLMNGHGGFFKSGRVGMSIMAAALGCPIRVAATAGEGGAWGIALLAEYLFCDDTLPGYLKKRVFSNSESTIYTPTEAEKAGFASFYRRFLAGIEVQRAAVKAFL